MPRAGRKTRRWIIASGLVVATVAAAAWLSWPRERLLMEIARPVLAVDTSKQQQDDSKERVWWLTSSRLLIITTERGSSNGTVDWKGHADVFDTGTHTRTRLVGLTNLLNRWGLSQVGYPDDFELSPAGTYLYWRAVPGHGNRQHAAVVTLLGGELRAWEERGGPSFWTDDQHLVEVMFNQGESMSQLRIHGVRSSRADRSIAPSSAETSTVLAQFGQAHPVMSMVDVSDEDHPKIARWWFDRRRLRIVNDTDVVTLPKNTQVVGWADDSHQDTIAFYLQRSETPLVSAWLHRFVPVVSVKPIVTEGLWVSRAGVPQMREIGYIPVQTDKDDHIDGDQLEQVKSLPDGKQISFIYRGMLYIMPITKAD